MSTELAASLYGPGSPTTAPALCVQHAHGRSYPRLACAGCGALLTDVREGGVVWAPDDAYRDGSQSPVVVLCKTRHCLGQDPRWQSWPWMPLDDFLIWLLQNTGAPTKRALTALIADAERSASYDF